MHPGTQHRLDTSRERALTHGRWATEGRATGFVLLTSLQTVLQLGDVPEQQVLPKEKLAKVPGKGPLQAGLSPAGSSRNALSQSVPPSSCNRRDYVRSPQKDVHRRWQAAGTALDNALLQCLLPPFSPLFQEHLAGDEQPIEGRRGSGFAH